MDTNEWRNGVNMQFSSGLFRFIKIFTCFFSFIIFLNDKMMQNFTEIVMLEKCFTPFAGYYNSCKNENCRNCFKESCQRGDGLVFSLISTYIY